MKISTTAALLFITAIFCAFLAGLFIGRNYNHSDIQVTALRRSEPLLSERRSNSSQETTVADNTKRLELNSATFEELCTLPGIGEVLAHRIIQYRKENRGFLYVEELLEIDGISNETFETLLNYVTVGG